MKSVKRPKVKAAISKVLNVPKENIVLVKVGGWIQDKAAPCALEGIDNVDKPEEFDCDFPEANTSYYCEVAIKAGKTIGRPFTLQISEEEVLSMGE